MRLICGLVMLDGSAVPAERIARMCEALQSPMRPGRMQVWHEGPSALGVLEFDPEVSGPLLVKTGGGRVVAADVRLDEGNESGLLSDAEVCASAVERLGDEAPLALLGDFALAAWDADAQELFLARDAMGVRPLVYRHVPGQFVVFASFASAIHVSGLVAKELDEEALAHQMLAQPRAEETLSRGVSALPPGHWMRVSHGGVRRECYWRPRLGERRQGTPAEAAEELRGLLERAVRSRVRGTGAIAAHLSGGLDSSAIAILAAREVQPQGRKLLGYSFLPDSQEAFEDERPFVEAVLRQEPEIVWKAVAPVGIEARWRGAMYADRVLSMSEDDPENAVCADASAQGANVVLSGWGGDEGVTFNGRGSLADALLRLRWGYLAREIRALQRQRGFSARGILYGDVITPILPDWVLGAIAKARGRHGGGKPGLLDLLAPELRRRLESEPDESVKIGASVRANQLRLLSATHLAQRTTNWALIGARYGMAFAFPLLDRRVVEFALSLPETWHLREGWKRRPFRDAMKGVLPESIRWRHGKLTPFPSTLFEMAACKSVLLDRVQESSNHRFVHQIFDMEKVRQMILSLPEPEQIRRTDSDTTYSFVLVSAVLQYARYVEEHFCRKR